MPPKSPEEIADSEALLAQMRELTRMLVRNNLANAVKLAQQASCGHGPLVDHFAELGRRYAHLLEAKKPRRFKVIEGGTS